jgi:argininosuccinate lyase
MLKGLVDDVITLKAAYDVVNKNPLGSAAWIRFLVPINRTMTTELLGFADLNYNVVLCANGPRENRTHCCIGIGKCGRYFVTAFDGCYLYT